MRTPFFSFRRVLLWFAVVIAITENRAASDWPRWRGSNGDGHAPLSEAAPVTLPRQANYLWKVKVGDSLGSPVVSGGRVYHLDHHEGKEVVHALDATNGKTRWSVPLDDVHQDHQSAPGPRSTPTVDGDRLYVQSCRGEFRCLAVADGRTLWRVNFVTDFKADYIGEKGLALGASRHGYSASPLVVGDRIFVNVGGQEDAGIVCFDKRNGEVIWKSQNDVAGYGGPVFARLAGIEQVITFTAEAVLGLRSDTGALLWRVPVKTSYGRHVASPVVLDDLVIVGSHQAGTMALRITPESDGCKAETAWLEKRIAINLSSPVVVDGHLYGMGPVGEFFCADARTGEKKWTIEVSQGGTNAAAQCVVLNKNILVLSESGELLLIAADPAQSKVISRLQVAAATWCNPAYVESKLYLRDQHELMCVDLRSEANAK